MVLAGSTPWRTCYGCCPAHGPPAFRARPPSGSSRIGPGFDHDSLAHRCPGTLVADPPFLRTGGDADQASSRGNLGRHAAQHIARRVLCLRAMATGTQNEHRQLSLLPRGRASLQAAQRPLQLDPIGDKLAFYEMCKAHALPTPAVLAAFAPTGKLLEFQSGQPPEHDLFVKPRVGLAGDGAERFRWRGDAFESERGRRMRREDLVDYLVARARNEKRTLLVQPNLSNHPDLRLETNGALATARLVTGQSTDGDVVAIFGFIYFARSDRITAQHGHVALIDVASGRLVPAPVEDGTGANELEPSG